MKKYKYQLDVVETIYDEHFCLLYNIYNEAEENENGFNTMLLICDIPNRKQIQLNDTEENRNYCMNRIEKYLLWE